VAQYPQGEPLLHFCTVLLFNQIPHWSRFPCFLGLVFPGLPNPRQIALAQADFSDLKLPSDQKDELLDDKAVVTEEDQDVTKAPQEVSKSLLTTLTLYSRVIRNCELLKTSEKKPSVYKCISKYCMLVGLFYAVMAMFLEHEQQSEDDEGGEDARLILPAQPISCLRPYTITSLEPYPGKGSYP